MRLKLKASFVLAPTSQTKTKDYLQSAQSKNIMIKVSTVITISAPIEKVWTAMTHHEGMVDWPDFHQVEILKKGSPHPDGLGCVRRVKAKGLEVTEEITKYDAHHEMHYQVSKINHPINHHGGVIKLAETENGTTVTWTSAFTMKSKNPIIKYIGGKILVSRGNKGFQKALDWVKRDLEKSTT